MSWSLPNTQNAQQMHHKRIMRLQVPKPRALPKLQNQKNLCALHQTASFDYGAFA